MGVYALKKRRENSLTVSGKWEATERANCEYGDEGHEIGRTTEAR